MSTEACHETKMYKRMVVKKREHSKIGDKGRIRNVKNRYTKCQFMDLLP